MALSNVNGVNYDFSILEGGTQRANLAPIDVSGNIFQNPNTGEMLTLDDNGRMMPLSPTLGRSTNLQPGIIEASDLSVPKTQGPAKGIDAQNEILRQSGEQYKSEKLALAGAQFAISVLNANAAYRQAQGTAQFNIQMARNQAKDSLFRGRQAAGQAQSQGRAMSDQAILAMAAQGQDVSGAGVQRVAGSYEAVAEQNAMQLEINGIKEALGFELEEVNYNFQVANAKINRDMTVLSSALNLGAQAYGVM